MKERNNVYVENTITDRRLKALADNPDMALDVTSLDLRRLPAHVRAELFSYTKQNFIAPNLEMCGDILLGLGEGEFSAPKLKTAGNIAAPHFSSFRACMLEIAGDINIMYAHEIELTALRDSSRVFKRAFDFLNSPPRSTRVRKPKAANRAP